MSRAKRKYAALEAELIRAKGYVIEFGQALIHEQSERKYLEDVLDSLIIELDRMGYEVSIPPKESIHEQFAQQGSRVFGSNPDREGGSTEG